MRTPSRRRVLAGGLRGLAFLLAFAGVTGASPQASGQDAEGPHREGPATPSAVDLRTVPPGGPARLTKPFLHPGGQDKLDREKADAERLRPGEGAPPDLPLASQPPPTTPE